MRVFTFNYFSGINAKVKSHLKYLEKFCEDFINDLKSSIDKSVTKDLPNQAVDESADDDNNSQSDWLMEEITHHALFAQNKCNSFCGRKELIGK